MGEVERLNKLLRHAVRGRLEATGVSVVKRWNGMSCMVANVNPRMDWHENNRKAAEEAEYTAELFAAAHNALPALLCRLEEMRGALERIERITRAPECGVDETETLDDHRRDLFHAWSAAKSALNTLSQTDEGERMEGDGE